MIIVNINNEFILIKKSIIINLKSRNDNYNVIIINKIYIKIIIKINILVNPLIITYFDRKKKIIKVHDFFIKIIIFTIITLIEFYFLNLYSIVI